MSIHGVPTTMAHRVVVTTIFDRSAFHSSTTRSAASRAAHSVSRATSSAAHLRDMSATTRACDHRRAYVGDDRPFEIRRSVKARCRLDRGGHVSRPQESAENWSPRSNSARVAASKPLRTRPRQDDRRRHRCETLHLLRPSIVSSSSSSDRGEIPSERNPGSLSEAVVSICISST